MPRPTTTTTTSANAATAAVDADVKAVHGEEEHALDAIPIEMKQLIRLVVRCFYSDFRKQAFEDLAAPIIVDLLVKHETIKETTLTELVFAKTHPAAPRPTEAHKSAVRGILLKLKSDFLVETIELADRLRESARQREKSRYWYINYEKMVNAVKYILLQMDQSIVSHNENITARDLYTCQDPTCGSVYDLHGDWEKYYDQELDGFYCPKCDMELVQDEDRAAIEANDLRQAFNKQMEPLRALLKKINAMTLKKSILDPTSAPHQLIASSAAERASGQRQKPGMKLTKELFSEKYSITIVPSGAHRKYYKSSPGWICDNTVDHDDSSTARDSNRNRVGGPDVNNARSVYVEDAVLASLVALSSDDDDSDWSDGARGARTRRGGRNDMDEGKDDDESDDDRVGDDVDDDDDDRDHGSSSSAEDDAGAGKVGRGKQRSHGRRRKRNGSSKRSKADRAVLDTDGQSSHGCCYERSRALTADGDINVEEYFENGYHAPHIQGSTPATQYYFAGKKSQVRRHPYLQSFPASRANGAALFLSGTEGGNIMHEGEDEDGAGKNEGLDQEGDEVIVSDEDVEDIDLSTLSQSSSSACSVYDQLAGCTAGELTDEELSLRRRCRNMNAILHDYDSSAKADRALQRISFGTTTPLGDFGTGSDLTSGSGHNGSSDAVVASAVNASLVVQSRPVGWLTHFIQDGADRLHGGRRSAAEMKGPAIDKDGVSSLAGLIAEE